MGAELPCTLRIRRTATPGKALLETDEIVFRGGDFRLKIPLQSIRAVEAKGGTLVVRHGEAEEARLELGAHAAKWKEKIANPKSRIDKLGVRAEQRVAIVGDVDASLARELRDRGVQRVDVARGKGGLDVIFVALHDVDDLKKLATLRRALAPNGAIWTIRAKGKDAAVTEKAARGAGRAAGLVDVKVARFSETHTAEKWVIPRAER